MGEIILINAPVRDPWIDAHARTSPPLGLASIGAVLEGAGYGVSALDLNVCGRDPENTLKETVQKEKPRLVGFSAATEAYPQAIQLAGIVKESDHTVLTVMGGPHVTFMCDEALEVEAVDVVVRGEGEQTILELAERRFEGKALDGIPGTSVRRNGKIYHNPDRPLLKDLDSLPIPLRRLFALEAYQYPGNLVTARGCPARCVFCAAPALSGGKYRVRSPEKVVEEMVHLASLCDLGRVTIVDDTFTVYRQRTKRICEMLETLELPLRWGCSTRANTVTQELLVEMRRAGCDEIQFGVESGSEEVLAALGKAVSLDQVRRAVEWARQAGMDVTCSFMFPHPHDTKETVRDTRRLMRELVKSGVRASVAVTTPFPGTEIWKRASEWGLQIQSRKWQDYDACTPVFSTPFLSKRDISLIITDLLYHGP